MAIYLSSSGIAIDRQLEDVVNFLEREYPEDYEAFLEAFPEWERVDFGGGAWIDHEAMGVDVEWSSWAVDWIEANTMVEWVECEPILVEAHERYYDEG